MYKCFLALLVMAPIFNIPQGAHALTGGYVGNGGIVVSCPSESQLLDYLEAQNADHSYMVSMGSPSQSTEDKVIATLDRLSQIDPVRAKNYREIIFGPILRDTFTENVLTPSQDSFHVELPSDCEIKQAALRLKAPYDMYDRRWLINRPIYESLDSISRAGLLIHEAIYDELIKSGATDSVGTRYFNAYISSQKMERSTPREYISIARKAGFKDLSYGGIKVSFYDFSDMPDYQMKFYPNGNLQEARSIGPGSRLPLKSGQSMVVRGLVSFYENKVVRTAFVDDRFKIQDKIISIEKIYLNPQGLVEGVCLRGDIVLLKDDTNRTVPFKHHDYIPLNQNGLVDSSRLQGRCE